MFIVNMPIHWQLCIYPLVILSLMRSVHLIPIVKTHKGMSIMCIHHIILSFSILRWVINLAIMSIISRTQNVHKSGIEGDGVFVLLQIFFPSAIWMVKCTGGGVLEGRMWDSFTEPANLSMIWMLKSHWWMWSVQKQHTYWRCTRILSWTHIFKLGMSSCMMCDVSNLHLLNQSSFFMMGRDASRVHNWMGLWKKNCGWDPPNTSENQQMTDESNRIGAQCLIVIKVLGRCDQPHGGFISSRWTRSCQCKRILARMIVPVMFLVFSSTVAPGSLKDTLRI